jgi:nucleotide-binding universal stress UspA family protein
MGRLSSSMQYLTKQLREKETALKDAREYLLKNGFTENQPNYIFRARGKQLADEIIDTAKEGNYLIIVLNHRPYRITRLFMQSVHSKVVSSLKDVTVCIVT